jgi:hypothetical protein
VGSDRLVEENSGFGCKISDEGRPSIMDVGDFVCFGFVVP